METTSLSFDFSSGEAEIINIIENVDTEEKIEQVKSSCNKLWDEGWHFVICTSLGKDSSVMTTVILNAAIEYASGNRVVPKMAIISSDTGLENPEIDRYAKIEIEKIKQFVSDNNIPATISIARPSLSNNYMVNILGGRTIASVGKSAKCSQMLKVSPINKEKNRIFRQLGVKKGARICSVVGKRRDESKARAISMRSRGERSDLPVANENGEYVLSPIADFTLDDIFYSIGLVRSELLPSYSDFEDLVRVYRGAEGGECMVNAYADGQQRKTSCGNRFGCWVCGRVSSDKSMESMLVDPQYSYMRPLNHFRNYLLANHFNPEKRNWLARTVNDDGTIAIAPNAYSPAFCEELLKFALSIDADEQAWALRNNQEPRFQILSPEEIIAIDVLWNRYGYQKGLHASWLYRDIFHYGQRYYPPSSFSEHPRTPLPAPIHLPFADDHYDSMTAGFRDLMTLSLDIEDSIVKKGQYFTDCNTDNEFHVDAEGAELFFQFELDSALDRYHGDDLISPTAGLHFLIRIGVVVLNKGGHAEMDRMLRLANQIHRHGIRSVLDNREKLVGRLSSETLKDTFDLLH
ncbi:hypothetical protein GCM10023116_29600 [Kistimonas scapharcae]|uniref:Phosphoadenosine phosphosulphate reductase domain-containing protein n=1 Tax=Kistimonas scapharcae TaxID=1036133 RepID=A0ABP8V4F0_9GAMM